MAKSRKIKPMSVREQLTRANGVRRAETIAEHGLHHWRPKASTQPDRTKVARRTACRGKAWTE